MSESSKHEQDDTSVHACQEDESTRTTEDAASDNLCNSSKTEDTADEMKSVIWKELSGNCEDRNTQDFSQNSLPENTDSESCPYGESGNHGDVDVDRAKPACGESESVLQDAIEFTIPSTNTTEIIDDNAESGYKTSEETGPPADATDERKPTNETLDNEIFSVDDSKLTSQNENKENWVSNKTDCEKPEKPTLENTKVSPTTNTELYGNLKNSIIEKEYNRDEATEVVILSAKGNTQQTVDKDLGKKNIQILNRDYFSVIKSDSIPIINETINHESDRHIFNHNKLRPIFRLSMRLSQAVFSNIDIPNADSLRQYDKAGYLLKLCGRGFPYLHQWRRRYCVLTKGTLYIYEKENSRGNEKNSSVIDLKYFDHVAEAMQKESRKASNVFIVTSQDRSFFDPGRHLFSAETLTDMHEWISKLREAIELIRNNNRPTLKTACVNNADQRSTKADPSETSSRLAAEHRRSRDVGESGHSEGKRRSGGADEDEVDAWSKKTPEAEMAKTEECFAASLEKKRKVELRRLQAVKDGSHEAEGTNEKELISGNVATKVPRQTSITKRVLLLAPDVEVATKPLESITKTRVKGPTGRRVPQHRRSVQMQQRASSMSALQYGTLLEQESGRASWKNQSTELLEEECFQQDSGSLNTSQPLLAYHYSSDEDSLPDEAMGSVDSYPPSPTLRISRPKSPPSVSYNITEIPQQPIDGLHVYPTSVEQHRTHIREGSPPMLESEENQDILDYRSLPRKLKKSSLCASTERVVESSVRAATSSEKPLSSQFPSGSAFQEMDALDNLLMNQSVHPASEPQDPGSDHESSEVSTCKAAQHDYKISSPAVCPSEKGLAKTITKFSSNLEHLQHHTAELEVRTKFVESEFSISKDQVSKLQEVYRVVQNEVDSLAKAVTIISEETAAARREMILQRQETERAEKAATSALAEAKRTQAEYDVAKANYESLIRELHSLITTIRTSLVITESEERVQDHSRRAKEELQHKKENMKEAVETKHVSSKDQGKLTGYQSFFQRPSSLIYSLTYKSGQKQTHAAEKHKKEEKYSHREKESDERKERVSGSSLEKKRKGDKHSQNSLEKTDKASKKVAKSDSDRDTKMKGKVKGTADARNPTDSVKPHGQRFSGLSLENIPLMDDHDYNERKRSNLAVGVTHVSINVSPPSNNLQTLKAVSSPSVSLKGFSSKPARPNALNISPSSRETLSKSSTPSPDSPTNPVMPQISYATPFSTSRNFRFLSDTTPFSVKPPTLAVARQPCMASLPEEQTVSQSRQGKFAISRQSSSPNIPVQRQNSSPTSFPLQRQHSLGTVPEEGQLPRQLSLMSVPEERPIVDQTLPLSPSPSMVSFPLSPSSSVGGLDNNFRDRRSIRNSMELVTGPIIAGSQIQESYIRQLPPSSEFQFGEESPSATSSLKKSDRKKNSKIVHV